MPSFLLGMSDASRPAMKPPVIKPKIAQFISPTLGDGSNARNESIAPAVSAMGSFAAVSGKAGTGWKADLRPVSSSGACDGQPPPLGGGTIAASAKRTGQRSRQLGTLRPIEPPGALRSTPLCL
jgi:hypothetical protein